MSPSARRSLHDEKVFEIEASIPDKTTHYQVTEPPREDTAPKSTSGCCSSSREYFDTHTEGHHADFTGVVVRERKGVSGPSSKCLPANSSAVVLQDESDVKCCGLPGAENKAYEDCHKFLLHCHGGRPGLLEIDQNTFEISLPQNEASYQLESSSLEDTVPKSVSRLSFLDLPPELRNMVFQHLLLDFMNSFRNAALRFVHLAAASAKRPVTLHGHKWPTLRNLSPPRPAIVSVHPTLRDEFAPMYRSTLLPIWNEHARLFNEKSTRYSELNMCGMYETGAKEELLGITDFGHGLADFILQELSSVGVAQLSLGERFVCKQARIMWESRRGPQEPFDRANVVLGQRRSFDGERRWTEKMQERVRFASTLIEAVACRREVGSVRKDNVHGVGYKA